MHAIHASGGLLLLISTIAFEAGVLSPASWWAALSVAIYASYSCMGAALYDRIVSALDRGGTCVFLVFISDGLSYVAIIGLLLLKATTAATSGGAAPIIIGGASKEENQDGQQQQQQQHLAEMDASEVLLVSFKSLARLTSLTLLGVTAFNAMYFRRRFAVSAAAQQRPGGGVGGGNATVEQEERARLVDRTDLVHKP